MTMCTERIGAVAIGRNEGERLRRCLTALNRQTRQIVYVDSGSTDGSVELARSLGVEVLELERSVPFTAARARNAGFQCLRQRWPTTEYVQFVDGDMEILDRWLATAAAVLDDRPEVVAVWGCRRERYPERSVYNRICDVEWRIGIAGTSANFGGDVMIRGSTFTQVGGYASHVIAAEDNELGIRLRAAGGVLQRIDRESTLHDADMYRFKQWWIRATRCGYAYAQVGSLHHSLGEGKFARELKRACLLGAILPTGAVALALTIPSLSCLVVGLYPINAARIAWSTRRRRFSWADSAAWGASCALAPIPQALGAARYYLHLLFDKRPEIIEHKPPLQITRLRSEIVDDKRE
jgi:GT2 family glycosyltransferase